MATKQSTESATAPQTADLPERLLKHASGIRNPAAKATLGEDLRLAARTLKRWRAGIEGAATATSDEVTAAHLERLLGEGE